VQITRFMAKMMADNPGIDGLPAKLFLFWSQE
jgi:hypothetical protein